MKTPTILLAALTCFLLPLGSAQGQTTPAPPTNPGGNNNQVSSDEQASNPAFWQAQFVNGGHYLVKLNAIVSASKHEYVGNGVARVVEVTLATDSSVVARFYWLEAAHKDTPLAAGNILLNRAEGAAKDIAQRTTPGGAKIQVQKDYPNTTHSHTVEYALQSEAALGSLYGSIMSAISTGRGRTWLEK